MSQKYLPHFTTISAQRTAKGGLFAVSHPSSMSFLYCSSTYDDFLGILQKPFLPSESGVHLQQSTEHTCWEWENISEKEKEQPLPDFRMGLVRNKKSCVWPSLSCVLCAPFRFVWLGFVFQRIASVERPSQRQRNSAEGPAEESCVCWKTTAADARKTLTGGLFHTPCILGLGFSFSLAFALHSICMPFSLLSGAEQGNPNCWLPESSLGVLRVWSCFLGHSG